MNSIVRLRAGALVIAGLVLLAGCEPRQRHVAEVNQDTILDDDYNARVQSVTAIPEGLPLDAGGMTMVNMIRDRLTEQLAKKYNAIPASEMVDAAAEYQLRMDPATNAGVTAGKVTRDDLRRQKKFELEAFGVGTNGDKPSDQEIEKAYQEYKDKPELRIKAAYTIKILQVPDEASGRRVIEEVKRTADFKGAAQKILGASAIEATTVGKDQTFTSDQLRPELKAALDTLKPTEITPEPVAIKLTNPQQPTSMQTVYAVAQLKSKEPERTLSKTDVRFLLIPIVLQKTHPDWKEHYRRELADFTGKSKIHIGLQKYEGLVDTYVRPLAASEAANPHAGMGIPAPQAGAPQ